MILIGNWYGVKFLIVLRKRVLFLLIGKFSITFTQRKQCYTGWVKKNLIFVTNVMLLIMLIIFSTRVKKQALFGIRWTLLFHICWTNTLLWPLLMSCLVCTIRMWVIKIIFSLIMSLQLQNYVLANTDTEITLIFFFSLITNLTYVAILKDNYVVFRYPSGD